MNNAEIIIIDDVEDFCKSLTYKIKNKYNYSVKYFLDVQCDEVLQYVKNNYVKIAILDWAMNPSGKEMYERLTKINPSLQIVLITGDPNVPAEEVMHFKAFHPEVLTEAKSTIVDRLPQILDDCFIKYQDKLTNYLEKPYLFHRKWEHGWSYVALISYFILDYYVMDEWYIHEDEWKFVGDIKDGETQKTIKRKTAAAKEANSYRREIDAESDVIKDLLPALIKVQAKNTSERKVELDFTITEEKETVLKMDKDELNGVKILCKRFEEVQVFKKILVHIKMYCPLFDILNIKEQIIPYTIYIPRKNIKKTRTVLITVDRQQHIIDTGYVSF